MASGKNRETTPRAAAYLYQSAQSTEEAKTRIDLLQRAWDLAQARDLRLPTAQLYKPMLAGLTPDEGFVGAAPAIIRLALAAGEPQTARSRSEERRVGKACVRTCQSRWSREH